MLRWLLFCSAMLPFPSCLSLTAPEGLEPSFLRCEWRIDPMNIDEPTPQLSWILVSGLNDEVQTAYQILVASRADLLDRDKGDLWDSGKVDDGETVGIPYQGSKLASNQTCFWKVRIWDKRDVVSAWSRTARWTMGLLIASDWKARWIGLDRPPPERNDLAQSQWIWYPDGDPRRSAPVGAIHFRREFTLPERKVKSALCTITADNAFTLYLNDTKIGEGEEHGKAFEFDLTGKLKDGFNMIAAAATNVGDKPNPAGFIAALRIDFEEGDPLLMHTDSSWEASQDGKADWIAAMELGACGASPWSDVSKSALHLPPPRYLRHAFEADKPIKRALLHATALGIFEMRINGQRVGDEWFAPGWTDYDKRIYYRSHDVTNLIQSGENVMAAILADGWYAGYIGYARERHHYGEQLRLLAQLHVEYEDGTSEVIATSPEWKASGGPLLYSDFLMGEAYDARKEMPGWDAIHFDDGKWSSVQITPKVDAALEAHPSPPVRVFDTLIPKSITEPEKGTYVFDMGQNFAGVVRLKVKGDAGRTIRLRFAERLDDKGMLYTTNLRSARCTDTYICKGEGIEVFEPRFTFHGFQYVEVTGLSGPPNAETITGLALSSDTLPAGSFACSDDMVNRLVSNIYWTQRANFIDIPTDCPQRDERLGWTGDAQVYITTACMLADTQAFFNKWLVDLRDAQRDDGQFPMVAPLKVAGGDGGPGWADAGVICPWALYQVYGDRRLLERSFPSMVRFIEFCEKRSTDGIPPKKFHCFGDWLSIKADTPKDVIFTAYFALSAQITAKAAEALGKDASKYWTLYGKIKKAFLSNYVDDEEHIKGKTQCGYVLALAAGLAEDDGPAERRLVADIESRDGHLSTGFLGTKDLMQVLSRVGRTDVAYRLLHNDTFPSWGFSIKHGATSIWERWNGWTPEDGFADPGMNSFAHYSFGAVAQWLFETVGGIRPLEPGFRKILIRPEPGGKLTWAETSYQSVRGLISTKWKRKGSMISLEVTIPPNTRAVVELPDRTEEIGSGNYHFTSTFE